MSEIIDEKKPVEQDDKSDKKAYIKKEIIEPALSILGSHASGVVLALVMCLSFSTFMGDPLGQIICGCIVFAVYCVPIYSIMWGLGYRDLNRQNFGRIAKDNFRGFKLALYGYIPVIVMAFLFIISKLNLFYNFVIPFKLLNSGVWPFINLVKNKQYLPDYAMWEIILIALISLVPIVFAGIFYMMGNRDYSPLQKVIYRKKVDEKEKPKAK